MCSMRPCHFICKDEWVMTVTKQEYSPSSLALKAHVRNSSCVAKLYGLSSWEGSGRGPLNQNMPI